MISVVARLVFVLLAALQGLGGARASKAERQLLHKLLDGYTNLERPTINEVDVMNVSIGLDFQQIIDVDEKNQMVTTSLWIKLHWTDSNLVWNPRDFDNITDVRIHSDILWRPDVLLYNSADVEFSRFYKSNVVVLHDGSCTFIPPGIFKSTCPIKIAHFPFDEQQCKLKFGSWTYSALKLNLTVDPEYNDQPARSSYVQNGEWDLLGIPAKWNVFHYDCCPEPYVDVTFTIHIRRRCLFYILNLVLPCALISSMTLLGFTLPPDSGEKLTLAVTILLSLTVFLLVIADTMPATSDAVPLIGLYFSLIMVMTSLSVVLTVIVLNFHHRTPNTHHMFRKGWARTILLEWLPFVLRLERQEFSLRESERGKEVLSCRSCCRGCFGTDVFSTRDNGERDTEQTTYTNAMSMSSSSPDAFVTPRRTEVNGSTTVSHSVSTPTSLVSIDYTSDEQTAMCYDHLVSASGSINQQLNTSNGRIYAAQVAEIQPSSFGTCARHSASSTTDRNRLCHSESCCYAKLSSKKQYNDQLARQVKVPPTDVEVQIQSLSTELRFIADRMRREDEYGQVCNDWRFAAMVLDRLFLWIMVLFTIGFTTGVMSSAPNFRLT